MYYSNFYYKISWEKQKIISSIFACAECNTYLFILITYLLGIKGIFNELNLTLNLFQNI